jgi:hypothetical protein
VKRGKSIHKQGKTAEKRNKNEQNRKKPMISTMHLAEPVIERNDEPECDVELGPEIQRRIDEIPW